jgi:hypothetical protein
VKDIVLWVRLLFNREQLMGDAIIKGKKAVWLTTDGGINAPMRINYYNPGKVFWGGSDPVEKCGTFRYRTFCCPGGKAELKEIGKDGSEWVRQWLS